MSDREWKPGDVVRSRRGALWTLGKRTREQDGFFCTSVVGDSSGLILDTELDDGDYAFVRSAGEEVGQGQDVSVPEPRPGDVWSFKGHDYTLEGLVDNGERWTTTERSSIGEPLWFRTGAFADGTLVFVRRGPSKVSEEPKSTPHVYSRDMTLDEAVAILSSPSSSAAPKVEGKAQSLLCHRITRSGIPCDLQMGHKEKDCRVMAKPVWQEAAPVLFCQKCKSSVAVAVRVTKVGKETSCMVCHVQQERRIYDAELTYNEMTAQLKAEEPPERLEAYESLFRRNGGSSSPW